ncbi:MAG: 50S ribosomal protein L30 [Candidatus Methanomethylophilaceae archaeon]|nr:50S ribosomal protein L30 [Candidatus Methanomethylophilaceae archaeon]MDY5872908.1 50S ribosomal protein L30 [Candidatus Methanomethylophilaceae archaeon]
MAYAVIRVRGQPDVNYDIEYTMKLLGINKVNHCAIVPENAVTKGMLQKIKDYTTYGEINEETLAKLIRVRGRLEGDKMITDEYLAENSDFKTVEELAKAIIENDYKMKDLEKGKPVFRLHPPVKGYEGNKRSYKNGGALGYRGDAINALIARML